MSRPGQIPFSLMRAGYPRLAVAAQRMRCVISPGKAQEKNLWFLRACQRLALRPTSDNKQDYPILLINRAQDRKRLAHVYRQANRFGFEFERIEAVNCADPNFDFGAYKELIGSSFYGKEHFLRGAVGCFLSHVAAWRRIADGKHKLGLVCEDDIRVLGRLPQVVDEFQVPTDADLVFVNARMVYGALTEETDKEIAGGNFIFLKFYEALNRIVDGRQQPISGPGGDGYLLTQSGASKLLDLFQQTKLSMEVDWFLLFHSLLPKERQEFLQVDGTSRFDQIEFASGHIQTYVMAPTLVEQASMGTSIGFDNPANYIHRDEILKGSAR